MDHDRPTHLDAEGEAAMVDVSGKRATSRSATAEAFLRFPAGVRARAFAGEAGKGSILGVARVAGIQAAKRCADLIPLCHTLPLDRVAVEFELRGEDELRVLCTARTEARTGVEMEALTGAALAALTVYDMTKALDKGIRIDGLRLLAKSGGKSGEWRAADGA
ncbi:MAG: cyclic pyranopterin monophosphate synthase MoaC [Planctomycetes bacterium]|nr:cyclic pyranopterin monophosphate synthase MoaC [Planctomycetota bacterium]